MSRLISSYAHAHAAHARRTHLRAAARGFTLVELMVAMAVGLLVVLAACFALISAQGGFRTTDAASQVRENARFATVLIRRIADQVGYQDYTGAVTRVSATKWGAAVKPDIYGFSNTTVSSVSAFDSLYTGGIVNGSCGSSCSSNHGDVLILRYQGQSLATNAATADGSVINCSGHNERGISNDNLDTRAYSVFYVAPSGKQNEPTLKCGYYTATSTASEDADEETDSGGHWHSEPLISGVETFQVLYGVYGGSSDSKAAGSWKRASDMASDDWYRVFRIRIGLVLRSAPNVSQDRSSDAVNYWPLGEDALSKSLQDPLAVSNTDGRLRQVINFTVDLRNPLNVQ